MMSRFEATEENRKFDLRVDASIYPSQNSAIKSLLAELEGRCPTQFILLSDTSGLFVMAQGEMGKMDNTILSSLIAGDMAASREIAQRTGEYQNYQLILREGQTVSTFIVEAGEHLLLFVQVSVEVPMGWARILIRETGQQIAKIMSTSPVMVEKLDLGLDDVKLSEALGEAFGSLWLG